jgi:hypothetical protein
MQRAIDPNALRLVCHSSSPAALGQAIVWNNSLLVPLHVLDKSSHAERGSVVLYRPDNQRAAVTKLSLIESFPSSDAAIFSADCDFAAGGSVIFTARIDEGDDLIVQWLTLRRGAVCVQSIRGNIREIVKIDGYEYRSASGSIISVRDISAIFLDKKMPLGSSGAPIYHLNSGKILGFVHGNAAENDSLGISLDPTPIWASRNVGRTVPVCRQSGGN